MIERKRYSAQFKRHVITEYLSTKVAQTTLEAKYAIGSGCLSRWLREMDSHAEEAFPGNGKQHAADARIVALERALVERDQQLAILKKALELVSQSPRSVMP